MSLKLYVSLIFISILLTTGVLPYIYGRRDVKGAKSLLFLTSTIDVWLVCQLIYLISASDTMRLLFHELKFIGVELAPAAILIITLEMSELIHKIKKGILGMVFIVPVLTWLIILTNETHHLFRKAFIFESSEGYRLIFTINGPWYQINMFYLLTLVGITMAICLISAVKASPGDRLQFIVFIFVSGFPWVMSIIYNFVLKEDLLVDITPLGLTMTIVVLIWALFYMKMMNIIPIAGHEVYQNVKEGIIVFDMEERILHMNPAARNIFDIGIDADVVGQDNNTLFRSKGIDTEDFKNMEGQFKLKFKNTVHTYTYKRQVMDHIRDKHIGTVLVLTDITELVDLEAELERIHAQELEADRQKLVFIGNMNREIRKVLNPLVGHVDYLQQLDLSEEDSVQIEMLSFSADILLKLINDITDYTRIEAGDLRLQELDFNLHEVFWHVVQIYQFDARKKGIELLLNMYENVPHYAVGDALRLTQMLNNLISNALKFTEQGSVRIEVRYEHNNLMIKVSDTGRGISKEAQDSIFDVYHQESDHVTKKFGGTGLGLAIVRELADLMKGSITLESKVGQGSIFVLQLPLKEGMNVGEKTEFVDFETFVNKTYNILLISDHDHHCEGLELFFNTCLKANIERIEMEPSLLGPTTLEQKDIIILDFESGEFKRNEIIERVRNYKKQSANPLYCVGLTANLQVQQYMLNDWMDDYLLMPAGFDKMNKVFSNLLFHKKNA